MPSTGNDVLTLLCKVSSLAARESTISEFARDLSDHVRRYLDGAGLDLVLVDVCGKLLAIGAENCRRGASVPQWPARSQLLQDVADEGELRWVDDVSEHVCHAAFDAGVRSVLAAPLKIGERVIGILCISRDASGALGETERTVVEALAPLVAVACENRRLACAEQQWASETAGLCQLADDTAVSFEADDILERVVADVQGILGSRGCSVALLEPGGEVLRIRAAVGITSEWRRDFELRVGEGVAGRVAESGRAEYVPDALDRDDFIFFDPSIRSLLTVPIRYRDKVIGTLSADSDRSCAFSLADKSVLCVAAAFTAAVLENRRLYAVLEKHTQDLQGAYKDLRILDRCKDEMVQNVSHELRTPLTFVKGYVDLLLMEDIGALNDDQRRFLTIVADRTTEIIGKVRDLIFLQQVEYLPTERSPVCLDTLALQAKASVRGEAARAGVMITVNGPEDCPQVLGDGEALLQVIEHLLENAIKFSPHGGYITVTIEEDGAMVRMSVADQGIGIPEDRLQDIFEPFYQIDGSTRRHYGGCGIGLSVARRIIAGHGGELGVESLHAAGSTFYFVIPKRRNGASR